MGILQRPSTGRKRRWSGYLSVAALASVLLTGMATAPAEAATRGPVARGWYTAGAPLVTTNCSALVRVHSSSLYTKSCITWQGTHMAQGMVVMQNRGSSSLAVAASGVVWGDAGGDDAFGYTCDYKYIPAGATYYCALWSVYYTKSQYAMTLGSTGIRNDPAGVVTTASGYIKIS